MARRIALIATLLAIIVALNLSTACAQSELLCVACFFRGRRRHVNGECELHVTPSRQTTLPHAMCVRIHNTQTKPIFTHAPHNTSCRLLDEKMRHSGLYALHQGDDHLHRLRARLRADDRRRLR